LGCSPEPNPEPVYVVTAPPDVRGIYDVWETVDRLQHGRNICQMLVWGREGAKAVLDGPGVVLGPGLHGFTDGNAPGGLGVVLVEGPRDDDDPPVTEIATSVREVFLRSGREGLDTEADMENLLSHGASAVAEMAAIYRALSEVSPGAEVTIVSDYDGVAKLMGAVARPKKPFMKQLVAACSALAQERDLRARYVHHPGHRSSWCGRHDLAHFNQCADALATEGSGGPPHLPGCPRLRKPGLSF
jgi:ribonuclease HI